MTNITLDSISGHAKEAKVCKIYKLEGDSISSNDVLFEIESSKGNKAITSNVTGKIISINVEEGSMVKVGDILAEIEGGADNNDQTGETKKFNYFGSLIKPQKKELETDIAIIGGGPGGYVAAIQAAKLGANVTLIEKENVGGTCLNWGCIPTKSLVRSSEVFNDLKHAESYGLHAELVSVDIKKVIDRKNKIVDQLVDGIRYLLDKHGVTVIKGVAQIVDEATIYVKEKNVEFTIKSKDIIIATGSETTELPIPGITLKQVITSKEALDLTTLPERLVIIGGGVIGMEFAFIFNSFGVKVSVVEYFDHILGNIDADIYEEMTQIARQKGIHIFTGSKVEEIIESEHEECVVAFDNQGTKKFICADMVLMAAGRTPYVGDLNLAGLNIQLNENNKGIKVNGKMQTNLSNIYAIGDVTGHIQLAHVASHQGIVAVNNIMGHESEMDYAVVPSAIFTSPEIAVVGVSEAEALSNGIEIVVGKFPFQANGKALTLGESQGFVKLIKAKETNEIIGGAVIGPHATDLIGEITLAVKNGLTAESIIETIHAHPTTAESIHESALATEGGALHFLG